MDTQWEEKKGLHLDSLVQKLFGWDLNPQIDALTERRFTIKLPKITPPLGIDSTGRKYGSLEESNLLASIQSFFAVGLEDRYWNRDLPRDPRPVYTLSIGGHSKSIDSEYGHLPVRRTERVGSIPVLPINIPLKIKTVKRRRQSVSIKQQLRIRNDAVV